MNKVHRLVCLLLLLGAVAVSAVAQQAITKNRATLRQDASSKKAPIARLDPGTDVDLLESSTTHGYYHVRTSDGMEGWIYSRSLQLVTAPSTAPAPVQPSTGTPAAPSTGIAAAFSPDWDKPTPNQTTFSGPDGECGPTGDGGDTLTNGRKNRTDVPASYHEVSWKTLQSLPYPLHAARSLMQWSSQQVQVIQPFEGVPVSVVGYLVKIKVEDSGSGESTNCHFVNPEEVDWHMPLVEHSGDAEATAVVVETTPRIRKDHPSWTPSKLSPWVNSSSPVRISGWTLLDPEHGAQVGQYRSTLWEIHPITRIEVFKDGQWIDEDSLP